MEKILRFLGQREARILDHNFGKCSRLRVVPFLKSKPGKQGNGSILVRPVGGLRGGQLRR